MKFSRLKDMFGNKVWGTRSGRHSYVISFEKGHGYTASWKDVSDPGPSSANYLIEYEDAVKTFQKAVDACKKHRKEHLLK